MWVFQESYSFKTTPELLDNSLFFTLRRSMDLKDMMSRIDTMNATTEQLVNSITITEGPVTNMSLAVQKQSRTPYSDATKVRLFQILFQLHRMFGSWGINSTWH